MYSISYLGIYLACTHVGGGGAGDVDIFSCLFLKVNFSDLPMSGDI